MLQRYPNDIGAWGIGQDLLDCEGYRQRRRVIETNDDDARIHIVLSLRQDFASDRVGVAIFIANHQQLAGPRGRIDSYISAHLDLGLGYVRIAGPDDSVDWWNAVGAVSHGGDSARSAKRENAIHSADFTCGENNSRGEAVTLRR